MKRADKVHISMVRGGLPTSKAVLRALADIEASGQVAEIIVRPKRQYRGLSSNADYWGNILPPIRMALHRLGNTLPNGAPIQDPHVHEHLSKMFLTRAFLVDPTTGEYEWRTLSTTDLTEEEMAEYKNSCILWAIEEFSTDHEFKFPERKDHEQYTLA